jgi:glycerol-1-phosphate dehydrogenase [NAD(P)+]
MILVNADILKLLGTSGNMTTQKIVINEGCLYNLMSHIYSLGLSGPMAAVYDTNTYAAAGEARPVVDQQIILNPEGLHADENSAQKVLEILKPEIKTIIAIGSGTIHDISRYCSHETGSKLVSCPTAASVDGFCSNVAAMTWHGSKKTIPAVAPILVAADLNIIAKAPIRLARSGIGDMLGKYVALADWKIGSILTGERYDENIAATMTKAVDIVKASTDEIVGGSTEAYGKLIYGLVLSGLAMQAFGNSRPASGAEHHISHIIEMHPQPLGINSTALHGEKVGVGTLIISQEYHDFMDKYPCNMEFKCSKPDKKELEKYFGDLTCAIEEENKNDCLSALDSKTLFNHWNEISTIVAAIPRSEELLPLYEKSGLMKSLSDIGVDESKRSNLVFLSPLVRNRLTLARIMRYIIYKGGE